MSNYQLHTPKTDHVIDGSKIQKLRVHKTGRNELLRNGQVYLSEHFGVLNSPEIFHSIH